jgi:predicted transcriptional regulator
MKLDKLATALSTAKATYGLDSTDLIVLNEIMTVKRVVGEVTIMEIVDRSSAASPATVHARIKLLCNMNLLKKVPHSINLSYKTLEKGPEYDRLVQTLGEV